MKRKRYKRWLLRVPFYLLLGAALACVIFYFLPISGRRIEERLVRLITREMGTEVKIRGACLYLSRGLLEIQEMTLPPPDESGIPLVFQDVSIEFSLYGFLFSTSDRWCEVQLTCPTEILLLFRENRFVIPPGYKYLAPLLEGITGRKSETGSFPQIKALVNVKNVLVAYESSIEEGLIVQPVLQSKGLSLEFSFQKGMLALITAKGALGSELEGELSGRVNFNPDGSPDQLLLFLSHLLLSGNTFPGSGFRLDVKNLRINEKIEMARPLVSFRHEMSMDSFSLHVPGVAKPFVENKIRTIAEGEMDGRNQQLKIHTAKISLSDSEIFFKGEMDMAREYQFTASLEQQPVSRRTLELLKQIVLPQGWDMTFQQQSFSFLLHATGDLFHPKDIQYNGTLRFADLALRHQDFPLPLTHVAGEIALDPSSLHLKNVRGKMGDGLLSLEGRLEGIRDFSSPERASLSWSADLTLQDLMMMVKNKIPLENLLASGRINIQGSLEMKLVTRDKTTTISLTQFDCAALVSDAMLRHPFLPEEVRNISGRFQIKPDVIKFQELKGSLAEGTLALQGGVIGEKYFWKQPLVSLEVVYSGGLNPVIQMAPEPLRDSLQKTRLKGEISTTTYLSIPLEAPDRISYYGDVSFSRVSFQPLHPSINGLIKDLQGAIRFEKENLLLKELSGNFAGMDFLLDARLEPGNLQMNITSLIPLEKLRTAIPSLANDFRATGTVELQSEVSLSSENLAQSLLHLDIPRDMMYGFSGSITSEDAAFAYRDMPVDLHHVKAQVFFNESGLWFRDAHLWCGTSPDCTGEGEIFFASNPPAFRFKVHAPVLYLKEWTGPWENTNPPQSRHVTMQDLTSTSPSMEVEGTVLADKIHYNLLEGENFEGHFIYNYFPSAPNKFSFDGVKVLAYGGKARASGNFIFPTGSFFYGVEGEAEMMEIRDVLSALRGRSQNLRGFITACITLAGESRKPETISSKVTFDLHQSRFIGNMIFVGLGRALKSALFDDITFTRVQGNLNIKNGAADFENLKFTSPLLNLNASGTVDFHENLDVIFFLMFEKKNILGLPLLRQLAQILEYMGKAILKFHITGALEDPKVNAIPLSADEIKKFFMGY